MSAAVDPVLVVVSFYDARPRQELDALLHDLATVPAGWPFSVLVVVNQERAEPTPIAAALPGLRVLHRPNAGYNIGAWEHGWRAAPGHEIYLFLQQECRVRRPGWLAPFVRRLRQPGVGLVGERANPAWAVPWNEIERRFAGHTLPGHQVDGVPAPRLATYRHFFASNGIDPGPSGDHLQTLVLAATGTTLARIGGFPIGRDYGEAIAAEIGISKRVQMLGLSTEEIGPRPFTWFTHPQWQAKAELQPVPPPRLGLQRWLQQIAQQCWGRDKPWLVLGKGPTFRQLTAQHRQEHHLFALNHVVREVAVDIAHAIDIDVVRSCRDVLDAQCRFLLMPRVPHVDNKPGERLLEQWFDELPELFELERAGRLVWYNCSTGKPHPGSPVIEVQSFSSEAALGLLAAMGVRTVRSLGIDGGRQYSAAFGDLTATTRLQNGQPLFDLQFAHIARIVAAHGIDYAPLVAPVRVCIRGDAAHAVAARVLEHSIRKHASLPVAGTCMPAGEAAPAGALVVAAAALAGGAGAVARGDATNGVAWLQPVLHEPWRHPAEPAAAAWVDAFAEAVNAGLVTAAELRRAIRRGDVDGRLLLPANLPEGAAEPGSAAEAQARELRRELAQLRLSRTWQLGRMLVRPVLAVQRRLWRRVR